MILENKVGQKLKLSKDNFNKKCAPKLRAAYSLLKKNLMILDLEN